MVDDDQLMLVTNMGQVIRIRVHGGEGDSIRIASRKTQGVRLFDVADDNNEKVVSAGLVRETDDDEDGASDEASTSDGENGSVAAALADTGGGETGNEETPA